MKKSEEKILFSISCNLHDADDSAYDGNGGRSGRRGGFCI